MTLQSDADMLLRALYEATGSPGAAQVIVLNALQLVELLKIHLVRHPDCKDHCLCWERGFDAARDDVAELWTDS